MTAIDIAPVSQEAALRELHALTERQTYLLRVLRDGPEEALTGSGVSEYAQAVGQSVRQSVEVELNRLRAGHPDQGCHRLGLGLHVTLHPDSIAPLLEEVRNLTAEVRQLRVGVRQGRLHVARPAESQIPHDSSPSSVVGTSEGSGPAGPAPEKRGPAGDTLAEVHRNLEHIQRSLERIATGERRGVGR